LEFVCFLKFRSFGFQEILDAKQEKKTKILTSGQYCVGRRRKTLAVQKKATILLS
jgi:hypothetical protein